MTGDNSKGQLGIGSEKISCVSYPTMVSKLAHRNVIDVACGSHHTLVMTEGKIIYSFGSNNFG